MDVSFSILRGLHLNDEVDIGDIKSSRGDICGDKDIELALFEALKGNLTLVLGDITVHDLDIFLDLIGQYQRVGISLGLAEDNGLSCGPTIDYQEICQDGNAVVEGAIDGQMAHGL